jgi:hypothetical protein
VRTTPLERVGIVVTSLVLSVGLIALLSGFFTARDQPGVGGAPSGPGTAFRDLGHYDLRAGDLRPLYNSNPPTSGPHFVQPVARDGVPLSDDQLLQALELGDIVFIYGGPAPPPGLQALASTVGAPFSPQLAAAGQAVIVSPRPRTAGIIALAWTRMLRVSNPGDPRLPEFARFWLGRGAAGR